MPDYGSYRAFAKPEHLGQLRSPNRFAVSYEEKRTGKLEDRRMLEKAQHLDLS